jgi:Ras-related protein Rab-1A
MEHDFVFKIVLVGDAGVGKSSLLLRFVDNLYSDAYSSTIGVDFKMRTVVLQNGTRVKLQLWDTTGQERFRSITESYYRTAHAIVLVYDITRRDSFVHVQTRWMLDVLNTMREETCVMLVGTKSDLETHREVTNARDYAQKHKMLFMETSAKSTTNVHAVFTELTARILATYSRKEEEPVLLLQPPRSISTTCC